MAAKRKAGPTRKNLPRSMNGVHRQTISYGCYKWQKDEVRAKAKKKGIATDGRPWSVSYYHNRLEWQDWLQDTEKRIKKSKGKKAR